MVSTIDHGNLLHQRSRVSSLLIQFISSFFFFLDHTLYSLLLSPQPLLLLSILLQFFIKSTQISSKIFQFLSFSSTLPQTPLTFSFLLKFLPSFSITIPTSSTINFVFFFFNSSLFFFKFFAFSSITFLFPKFLYLSSITFVSLSSIVRLHPEPSTFALYSWHQRRGQGPPKEQELSTKHHNEPRGPPEHPQT